MGNILHLAAKRDQIRKTLGRSFQSGHLNFLLGSGASHPAISVSGALEAQIAAQFAAGQDIEAKSSMYDFLAQIQAATTKLIHAQNDANNTTTVDRYEDFIEIVETILAERRTTLLPKQATIFTTNYDLFIEQASISFSALKLNDGFSRVPSLDGRMQFSPRTFFNITYNTGNLYNYKVEIPCLNLIKLHGSLSWKKEAEEIIFQVAAIPLLPDAKTPEQLTQFIEQFAVVLPQTTKFRTTVMDRTYYDLLRIFANELDRENVLLIAFGFSFGDEHILDITRRALKNPTLRLVVFAYDHAARDSCAQLFGAHNNVDIIVGPPDGTVGFSEFNETLRSVLPQQ